MDLSNQYFQDFPIEFKEINPSDFPHFIVENKIIIEPDENGFINSALLSNIDIKQKNTVIINAGVGQGKTYSIIQIIKKFYEAPENYLIFVASPFTSLVQQYCLKIESAGIPENQIYSYDYIGNEMQYDAWNSKVQVLTVNALLGNPGEDAPINADLKRNYINYLKRKCEETNRKVVFIYDEIHDAIHNFKEEYIFNLWKWKNVIQKNFIISATFNEASKVVIEYLAELTDNKIQIIESKRKKFPDKQSELYLHFDSSKSFENNSDILVSLVEDILSRNKNLDILSFSKKLADDICSIKYEGVGAILESFSIPIQNCTSDLFENQRTYREPPKNRYDASKCNIGTNYKSGVSIEKDNHAFIIIMPPLGRKGVFKNSFGIFSNGIISIIQAIARQRKKGEIHIVLSPPDKFQFDTLPFSDPLQKLLFERNYNLCENYRSNGVLVEYKSFESQDDILSDFYHNTLVDYIQTEIDFVNTQDRQNKVRLLYPEYKLFKLNHGEDYLSGKIKFFGKDISSYVVYAAFTNQFLNCNLKGTNIKPPLFVKEDKFQFNLERFFSNYIDEDTYNSLFYNVTDKYKYFEIRNEIFDNHKLMIRNNEGKYQELNSFSNKSFEQQLIAFVQRKFYPHNIKFSNRYNRSGFIVDDEYKRGDYFLSCISHALRLDTIIELPEETKELIDAYKKLNGFREKVACSIKRREILRNQVNYINKTPEDGFFTNEDTVIFHSMLTTIVEKDYFIKNEIFEFKRFLNSKESVDLKLRRFYTYLKNDFFKTKTRKIENVDYDQILQIFPIPDTNAVLDLISKADINIPLEGLKNIIIVDGNPIIVNP